MQSETLLTPYNFYIFFIHVCTKVLRNNYQPSCRTYPTHTEKQAHKMCDMK